MTVLSGETIRQRGIIAPHAPRTKVEHAGIVTTYGESLCGYDLRLDAVHGAIEGVFGSVQGWWLRVGAFVLASAVEKFTMPKDVVGIVHDKSSWARRGLAVQNTVIEPGWRGYLTLELTNHSDEALFLPKGCGICQVLFHLIDRETDGYSGKYQDQPKGPVEAR